MKSPQFNFFNMKRYITAFKIGDDLSNFALNLTDPFFRLRGAESRLT